MENAVDISSSILLLQSFPLHAVFRVMQLNEEKMNFLNVIRAIPNCLVMLTCEVGLPMATDLICFLGALGGLALGTG